jgi:predicted metal-binding membrane protein
LLAWLYVLHLAAGMGEFDATPAVPAMDMPGMMMPGMGAGTAEADAPAAAQFALTALMWIVMMVGMMLPSAAPTILLFAAIERKHRGAAEPFGRTAAFLLGYLIVWTFFSLGAAFAQLALLRYRVVSPGLYVAVDALAGAIFIGAGIYEFSPLKGRCLALCRSPLDWLPRHWRPSRYGALRMGLEHGLYCVGCCWALMLILFAVGVMNLLWIAVLAAAVLAQKVMPGGAITARLTGVALIAWGLVLIARA